jgi:hypothetical protein
VLILDIIFYFILVCSNSKHINSIRDFYFSSVEDVPLDGDEIDIIDPV